MYARLERWAARIEAQSVSLMLRRCSLFDVEKGFEVSRKLAYTAEFMDGIWNRCGGAIWRDEGRDGEWYSAYLYYSGERGYRKPGPHGMGFPLFNSTTTGERFSPRIYRPDEPPVFHLVDVSVVGTNVPRGLGEEAAMCCCIARSARGHRNLASEECDPLSGKTQHG